MSWIIIIHKDSPPIFYDSPTAYAQSPFMYRPHNNDKQTSGMLHYTKKIQDSSAFCWTDL